MQHSLTILFALTVLGILAPIQAVVHGIQPLSNHHDVSTDNRNGYRYNGPAHKYLPAASAPAIDAVTTTGHWQPNPVQSQQTPYEINYSSKPMLQQQQQQQQGYKGPFSMQYYDKEAQKPQLQQQQQLTGNSYRKESQQQLSANTWRQEQQQQHQQLSSNSYQKEQQQHFLGSNWKHEQHQKPQQLTDNSYPKEQQQQHLQPTGNTWQQQQHQKPQQLTDSFYSKEQQQQHLQPTGNTWQQQQYQKPQQTPSNAWQQQQQGGRQQHLEAQQQHLDSQQQQHATLHQHNNLHTFPYAGNNKIAAASAAMDQLGASYHLSGAANGNRFLDTDLRDNQLMTQVLLAPYQQPSYESQLGGGGSANYVQMQSNSYELPASFSTQSVYSEKYRPQMEMSQSSYHYGEKMPIYNQPDYLQDTSSHAHSTAPMTFQPSREFQAPYF
ncbi:hypothetical protein ACLKA6_015037 [Drosophila palustris]